MTFITQLWATEEDKPFVYIDISMTNHREVREFIESLEHGKKYDSVRFYKITSPTIPLLAAHKDLIAQQVDRIHTSFASDSWITPFSLKEVSTLSGLPIVSITAYRIAASTFDLLKYFPKIEKFVIKHAGVNAGEPD